MGRIQSVTTYIFPNTDFWHVSREETCKMGDAYDAHLQTGRKYLALRDAIWEESTDLFRFDLLDIGWAGFDFLLCDMLEKKRRGRDFILTLSMLSLLGLPPGQNREQNSPWCVHDSRIPVTRYWLNVCIYSMYYCVGFLTIYAIYLMNKYVHLCEYLSVRCVQN